MNVGTLVPFLNKVALPGDTWDIHLNTLIRTEPTQAPLFGSFKFQADIFLVPLRLYNAALHMNMLGIGNKMQEAYLPLMEVWGANSERVAIENPVGWLSTHWQKPSQIIEPYYFGDNAKKRTCLWLRGLPLLKPTDMLAKPMPTYTQTGGVRDGTNRYFAECVQGSINRSKTFHGVAEAMADQWGF